MAERTDIERPTVASEAKVMKNGATNPADVSAPSSKRNSGFVLDIPLIVAVLLFWLTNIVYTLISKRLGGLEAAPCEGCEPISFKFPLVNFFFGNMSSMLAIPFYIFLESYYYHSKGLKHGSQIFWDKLFNAEGQKSRQEGEAELWGQGSWFGIVFRSGKISPEKISEHASNSKVDLRKQPPKPRVPFYYWWLIPGFAGSIGSVCKFSAINTAMSVSIQTFLSTGGGVIVVAILSWWWLKRRLYFLPHGVAVIVVIIGLLIVAFSGLQNEASAGFTFGLVYTLIQTIGYSINATWHDYMLHRYRANPLEVLSLDSTFTCIFVVAIGFPLLSSFTGDDYQKAAYMIGHDKDIRNLILTFVLVHAPTQVLQYYIINRRGSLAYYTINASQNLFIFLAEFIIPGFVVKFNWLELIGGIVTFLGTITYVYLIPIRKWFKGDPPLEVIIQEEKDALNEELYERFLKGDGNSMWRLKRWIWCLRCNSCNYKSRSNPVANLSSKDSIQSRTQYV